MKPTQPPKSQLFIGIGLLALLIIVGTLLAICLAPLTVHIPGDDDVLLFPGQGGAVEGYLPNMDEDTLRTQLQKQADESLFAFKINTTPIFDAEGEGNLRIENPHHNIYPFVVEIYLTETGEKIYDSGGILPNHHIDRDTLMRALPLGTYEAIAYIRVFDPDTNEYCGKTAAALTLQVYHFLD